MYLNYYLDTICKSNNPIFYYINIYIKTKLRCTKSKLTYDDVLNSLSSENYALRDLEFTFALNEGGFTSAWNDDIRTQADNGIGPVFSEEVEKYSTYIIQNTETLYETWFEEAAIRDFILETYSSPGHIVPPISHEPLCSKPYCSKHRKRSN